MNATGFVIKFSQYSPKLNFFTHISAYLSHTAFIYITLEKVKKKKKLLKIQDKYKDAIEGERGGRINWELGTDICILLMLCIK